MKIKHAFKNWLYKLPMTSLILALILSAIGSTSAYALDSITFNSSDTYLIPAGVCYVDVDAYGQKGGDAFHPEHPHTGGNGSRAQATLTVTAGETLYINVNIGGAGSGGGASDVRQGGSALENRVIVAGGGGGAGFGDEDGANGGAGGGGNGGDPAGGDGGNNGSGGAGGIGSTYPYGGLDGNSGNNWSGGSAASSGGGGGGGYGGGGGGGVAYNPTSANVFGGGGGGGGSLVPAGGTLTSGANNGNGYVVITPSTNCTVSFNANGGDGSMDNQTSGVAANLSANTFTRASYSFTGWDTAADGSGTDYADGASYSFDANITLYAQWTLQTNYTVIFDANGGSGSMSNQTHASATNLTANTFTRTGYTFTGWNTDADGVSGTDYADGASYAFDADVTLYAKWTINQYTISFEENGGSSIADITADYGASVSAPAAPTRSGYTFGGWYSDAGFTSAYIFSTMPAANITLYAKWTANPSQRLTNGGFNIFNKKIPTSWKAVKFGIADGKTTTKKEGAGAVKIVGSGAVKTLSQTLLISGSAGESFTFSFWVKGSKIPKNTKLCQGQVKFYENTTLKGAQTIKCPTGTFNWKFKTLTFTAPAAYTKVVVIFTYSKATGTVFFDLASLIK